MRKPVRFTKEVNHTGFSHSNVNRVEGVVYTLTALPDRIQRVHTLARFTLLPTRIFMGCRFGYHFLFDLL